MAVTIKRRQAGDVLSLVGLGEAPYVATRGLRPISWPHYKPGSRVQLIAKTGAWKYICRAGDTGIVEKIAQALMPGEHPDGDLYIIKLDTPRVAGKEVAYLTYKELSLV